MIETPNMTLQPVSDAEFRLIQQLIYKMAGVHIKEHKKTMVANRLRRRLDNFGFSSYKKYYDFITQSPEGHNELIEFVNCLTTNETFFFRHGEQLDTLADKLIPRCLERISPSEKCRIWSSACSSGEEPYSVAMLLDYKLKPEVLNRIEILASDINMQVIERARQGLYKPYALQKIQPYFKTRYFKQLSIDQFALSESIRDRVQFFRHNLLDHNPYGRFDIILCRNVMIYFDLESKNRVLHQLNRSLKSHGYLITGYAESLFRTETNLKYIQPTLYNKG